MRVFLLKVPCMVPINISGIRLLEIQTTQPDPQESWMNVAVSAAFQVLKRIPGAAFDGEPFMVTSIGKLGHDEYVACNCFYHSVVFLNDFALVFSREEGGMVPWITAADGCLPDPDYFDSAFRIPVGASNQILATIQSQQETLTDACEDAGEAPMISG
jgi:hypothetical protein